MNIPDLILGHVDRPAMVKRLVELSARPGIECLYFGCLEQAAHRLWGRCPSHVYMSGKEGILKAAFGDLHAKLCWNSNHSTFGRPDETEGRALLIHRVGWTAIAFWDRSVDRRGASNSAFFCPGTLTFAQMVRAARTKWPEVWARFTFEVVEVDRQGRRIG